MNAIAVFTGGHVRTGLEDNPYFDFGHRSHARNAKLVRRVAELARLARRPAASTQETRVMLGLPHTA